MVDDTKVDKSVDPNETHRSFECQSVGMAEIDTTGPEIIEFNSDRQRHLLVDISSATQVDTDLRSNDDLPDNDIETESSNGQHYESGNSVGQFEVRKTVKCIDGQNIKYVKREKVKISPKSKYNKTKRSGIFNKFKSKIKFGDNIPRSEDTDSDESLVETVDSKLGKFRRKHGNKVGSIIAAFEDNICMYEADPEVCDDKKEKIGNAFTRMMESARGGFTPSPMKRKKKRLAQVKPLSLTKMDRWLQKE